MKNKVLWLDNARFIVILTVLIAHAPIDTVETYFLHPYAMPFFYLSAGFFLKKEMSFIDFVKAKFKRLMVPYVAIAIISFLCWLGSQPYSMVKNSVSPVSALFAIVTGVPDADAMAYNIALWFLPSLFTTLCWTFLIIRFPQKAQWPVLLVGVALGGWMSSALPVRLPWSMDLMLIVSVFTYMGYRFKEQILSFQPFNHFYFVLLLGIYIAICAINPAVDLFGNNYGNLFLFLASSFIGMAILINIAKRMPEKSLWSYLGSKSFDIFSVHMIFYQLLTAFIFHIGAPHEFLPPFDGSGVLHKVFVVLRAMIYICLSISLALGSYKLYDLFKRKFSHPQGKQMIPITTVQLQE